MGLLEDEAGVEGRLQVGQAGADAEASAEGARVEVPDLFDVAGAGDAAEGCGGLGSGGVGGFGRGDAAAEAGEEGAAAVPGEVEGEGAGEEGGAEDGSRQLGGGGAAEGIGFAGAEAVAGKGVEVAGREDGFWFHGWHDGGKQKEIQEFSLISQMGFAWGKRKVERRGKRKGR